MRASFSFGLSGFALAVSVFLMFPYGLFLFPIAGLVASLLIHQGTRSVSQRIAAGVLATAAFGFTGMIVSCSLISLQADIEPAWGAFAWGLGFGIAGIVCGQFFSQLSHPDRHGSGRIRFAGVITGIGFAISGAVAGFLGFLMLPAWNIFSLAFGIWLAFQLGGILCDAGWRLSMKLSNPRGA